MASIQPCPLYDDEVHKDQCPAALNAPEMKHSGPEVDLGRI